LIAEESVERQHRCESSGGHHGRETLDAVVLVDGTPQIPGLGGRAVRDPDLRREAEIEAILDEAVCDAEVILERAVRG
jgi:hypothetical protein